MHDTDDAGVEQGKRPDETDKPEETGAPGETSGPEKSAMTDEAAGAEDAAPPAQAAQRKPGILAKVPTGVWALLVIALSTAIRYWFVASGQLDLVQDEAQYWDWTRALSLSYYSKGPLVAWIIAIGTSVFGDTELGVRIGAVVGSCLAQCVLYGGLAWGAKRPGVALATLLVANTAPLFMASGILMTTDNPLMVCWAGALFSLYMATAPSAQGRIAADDGRATPWLVVLGVCVAVGVLGKYMMLAFVPVAALYCLFIARVGLMPRGLARRLAITLVVGALVGFLPILLWNVGNDFVGFRHVFGLAGAGRTPTGPWLRPDRFAEYAGSQIGMVTPWWFFFMIAGAVAALGRVVATRPGQDMAERSAFRLDALLVAGFWPLWGWFLVWSLHKKVYPNWAAVSYVAGLSLAGMALYRFWTGPDTLGRRRWKKAFVCLGVACVLLLHGQNLLPLPDAYNPTLRLKGWQDLGHKVEELRQSRFDDPSSVFLFSDAYTMTSALAFYVPGQPRTYCADFGRRMNQYDLWPGPENVEGHDAIFVRKDFRDKTPHRLSDLFDRVEQIRYQSRHRGEPARKFTIWLCYGYKGPWPSFRMDEGATF